MCTGGSSSPKQPPPPPPLPPPPKLPPPPPVTPPPTPIPPAATPVQNQKDKNNTGIAPKRSKREQSGQVARGTSSLKIPLNLGSEGSSGAPTV